jgi:DNA-binding response OmpR family regulator
MRTETTLFKIVLVEDNSADAALVRQALKEHYVDCALHLIRDGAQAIQWICALDTDAKVPPLDLLLLDMHLPKHDGEDVLKCLRSTEHYAQTPVIAMTSQDSSGIEKKAAKNAALVYFRKPSTLDEFMQLGSIVRQVLAGHKNPGGPETALDEKPQEVGRD